MKRYLYTTLFIFIIAAEALSQVGINTSVIQDGVTLQVESSNKGMLFPRVALSSRASTAPLATTIPMSTMVFNTATAGSFPDVIFQGLHWWNADEGQCVNASLNLNTVMVKYTNAENTTDNLLEMNSSMTSDEFKLCALLKLGFTTKDIAEYNHISVRTVQARKSRLRKSFGISADIDLYNWIDTL
ncbi:helix-turn-helix transcriptional regulator [Chryseobacterium antibioticum]|uniref:helix-turn-helix transcriptional regulator n=1 Tax=Chryseobacterium antibioticum TaxID=2728847 RepID=UPI001627FF95|nr:hypothetical protein [Chryseobacterium antibioticum]